MNHRLLAMNELDVKMVSDLEIGDEILTLGGWEKIARLDITLGGHLTLIGFSGERAVRRPSTDTFYVKAADYA